jgi:LPPG:FO 2-phospho-L-lactate transferase
MRVTALAGGVGGAKLLIGLQGAVPDPEQLVAIVNSGDDATIYGVHVSPDIDIVTYWLAGIADRAKGWGIDGDTFRLVEAVGELGGDTWFQLGDRDFGTCVYRTQRMNDGAPLSVVTDEIRRALGVSTTILPMSNEPVRTKIVDEDGRTLEFQDYFVRLQQKPRVKEVMFAGMGEAKPAPGVLEAIRDSEIVIVCPSNPVVSVGPILGLPEVRDALRAHPRVIAVSPIVRGAALKGPAATMLDTLGHGSSASSVARMYSDLCNTFVVDSSDVMEIEKIETLGMRCVPLDTIMRDEAASIALATALLEL